MMNVQVTKSVQATESGTESVSAPLNTTIRQTRNAINRRTLVIFALLIVYLIWSTTYLGIRYALESFPPYIMMGIRFVIAGGSLFALMHVSGATMPTPRQWRNAGIVGLLLMVGGMGSVALAEESVSSGLAATLVATAPLFATLFSMIWGHRPARADWIGVVLGIVGVGLLTLEGNLQANPAGILLMVFATSCWALGSVWSQHLDLPKGAVANSAEMLIGGIGLLLVALLRGEHMTGAPTVNSVLALVYLITFGSLATMTAYMYLLKTVSPTLATSYALVNPALALLLGVLLAGEHLTGSAFVALPIILIGIAFVAFSKRGGISH